jgi:two-component system, cell cycle response regulator DivK
MTSILLVEDAHDIRQIVELLLDAAGYIVWGVADGVSALRMAEQNQPDLIIMDLALPQLDGWEATRRLKANRRTRHIPVIAFTAHVFPEEIERAMTAGCAVVIPKPFEFTTLLHEIDNALGQGPSGQRTRSVGQRTEERHKSH